MNPEVLSRVQQLLAAGDAAGAGSLLHRCLDADPGDEQAATWLARLSWQLGDTAGAIEACERALAAVPASQPLLRLLVEMRAATREFDMALEALARARARGKEFSPIRSLEIGVLLAAGRHREALACVDSALEADPGNPDLQANRCVSLHALGRYPEAVAAADTLLRRDAGRTDAYLNKAAALLELERFPEALETVRQGLRLAPQDLGLQTNLGTALLGCGQAAEALRASEEALRRQPQAAGLVANRILALVELGRWQEALPVALAAQAAHSELGDFAVTLIEQYLVGGSVEQMLGWLPEDALRDGGQAAVLVAVGQKLLRQGHLVEAEPLTKALAVACPGDPVALYLRAYVLAATRRFAEADELLARLRQLPPGESEEPSLAFEADAGAPAEPPDAFQRPVDARLLYTDSIMIGLKHCDWTDYRERTMELIASTSEALEAGEPPPVRAFCTHLLPFSMDLRLGVARWTAATVAVHVKKACRGFTPVYPREARRLRIGYVSADFRNHATGHLTRTMYAQHSRPEFEIYAYDLRPTPDSSYYRDIVAGCDHHVDLSGLSIAEMAQRINDDGIHILVNLQGYTRYGRPELFALRPAPVQVSFLAYPGTLGAGYVDYLIADTTVLPEEDQRYYTEVPVYLPDCYQVNDPWLAPAAAPIASRAEAGLPRSGVVYTCMNGTQKITPGIFDIWTRILRQVPGSVLWLLHLGESVDAALRREAERRGLAAERLVFAPVLPREQHLDRLRLADVFLDTPLYNGHTTASDALRAGVPVLTCPGRAFPARVAASLVRAVGLPDLVAADEASYQQLAVNLGLDVERRQSLKRRLRAQLPSSALFDSARYVRHLEAAYRAMWACCGEGGPVQAIHIAHVGS